MLLSIYRWAVCLEPYCQTGNAERAQIRGADLLNLVTYITAWPDATLDEMAVFMYNKGGFFTPVRLSPNASRSSRSPRKRPQLKPIRPSGRTCSSVFGNFGIAPPLSEFFRF